MPAATSGRQSFPSIEQQINFSHYLFMIDEVADVDCSTTFSDGGGECLLAQNELSQCFADQSRLALAARGCKPRQLLVEFGRDLRVENYILCHFRAPTTSQPAAPPASRSRALASNSSATRASLSSSAAASTSANSIAPIAANASCTRGPHRPISFTVGTIR